MTDRALWVAAKDDYRKALAIATEAWSDVGHAGVEDATIQAAAATVLIHITKLRSEPRIHVQVPPQPVPAAAAQSSGAVPPACPKCGGGIWDNRENKKNPKAPDWKCKSKTCVDDKGYVTAGWVKPKGGVFKPVPAGSYDDKPEVLQEDDTDSLPF
jgi:hypothetical protein